MATFMVLKQDNSPVNNITYIFSSIYRSIRECVIRSRELNQNCKIVDVYTGTEVFRYNSGYFYQFNGSNYINTLSNIEGYVEQIDKYPYEHIFDSQGKIRANGYTNLRLLNDSYPTDERTIYLKEPMNGAYVYKQSHKSKYYRLMTEFDLSVMKIKPIVDYTAYDQNGEKYTMSDIFNPYLYISCNNPDKNLAGADFGLSMNPYTGDWRIASNITGGGTGVFKLVQNNGSPVILFRSSKNQYGEYTCPYRVSLWYYVESSKIHLSVSVNGGDKVRPTVYADPTSSDYMNFYYNAQSGSLDLVTLEGLCIEDSRFVLNGLSLSECVSFVPDPDEQGRDILPDLACGAYMLGVKCNGSAIYTPSPVYGYSYSDFNIPQATNAIDRMMIYNSEHITRKREPVFGTITREAIDIYYYHTV